MAIVNPNDLSFKYIAFGLKIHSEIPIPELISSKSETADIIIYLGEIDLPTNTLLNEGLNYKIKNNAIYRFWDEIGKFKITNSSIKVDPVQGLNEIILRSFILGTIFATLLRLRGLFVLHASSVNINGFAISFSGFKGYGKSTTAMAFYNEGYPVVADDYIAIEFDTNNIPFITPGFPNLRLSPESRISMGLNLEEGEFKSDIIDKTYQYVPKLFSTSKFPLKKIYILQRGEMSKIINLKPQEAFIELVKNTFGIHIFSKLELPDNFFQCEKIVKNVDVSILEIPDSLQKLQEVVKIVEEDIGDGL